RSWAEVVAVLTESEMFWLSTVRRDGRPHVTPLPAIWVDGALLSAPARKSRNRRTWRPIRVASSLRVPTGFTRDSMLSWREPPAGLPTRTTSTRGRAVEVKAGLVVRGRRRSLRRSRGPGG